LRRIRRQRCRRGRRTLRGDDDEHRHDWSLVGDYELMGFWALEGPGWVVSFTEGAFGMFKGAFIWGVPIWACGTDGAVRAVGG
jgi:hypothetical protein